MRRMISVPVLGVCLLCFQGSPLSGQGQTTVQKPLTLKMAVQEPWKFFPRPLIALAWHPDGRRVTWVKREGKDWKLVAAAILGGPLVTLTSAQILEKAAVRAGFKGLGKQFLLAGHWNPDGRSLRLFQGGALYEARLQPPEVQRLMVIPKQVQAQAFSPGDRQVAYVKDFNILVLKRDGSRFLVTRDGNADLHYGVSVSREEFGIKDGLWWDAAGRRLAFYREDQTPIASYPYVDFTSIPARAVHGRYPMAGKRGSAVKVGIYDSFNNRVVWLHTDPAKDEYLTNITWSPSGASLFVAHVNRAQNRMDLVEYEASSGKLLRRHFSEENAKWIEPESGPIFLPDGSGSYLWFSYRDGFRQLYLYSKTGTFVRQVTRGSFDISTFKSFDSKGRGFYFETTGPDPRQLHLYYASLGGVQRAVTSGRGQHHTRLSPDGRHLIDAHSSLVLPLAIDILDTQGRRQLGLLLAKNPLQSYRLGKQQLFTVKSKDGSLLYGHVILPPGLKPGERHPVLQYVYGGPHVQLVKDTWLGGRSRTICWLHFMASQGYIVLRLDNHGTPNRGIAFEQAIFRHLGSREVEDQSAALDYVLAKGYADARRVGVTGWSFGGFMTLSLMTRRGSRYAAGVAGAPVTDWRFYETGYGERYMDRPEENPKGYLEANPAEHLKGLKGRLLVVQGTADKTVMWQNTIVFLDRCIKAGVPVDYMVYPGQLHGLTGRSYSHFMSKMTRFFDEHLHPRQVLVGTH